MLAAPLAGAAGSDGAYRLAGVMSVGAERIGFLEVPGGGQVLVRRGSTVDGGTVSVFSDRELRIVFDDRTIVLELDGVPGSTGAAPSTRGVVQDSTDSDHAMVRTVDGTALLAALDQAGTSTPAVTTRGRVDHRAELGRRFARVANLPLNSRVIAVNGQPVSTAERAIAEVQRSLEAGNPAILNLASIPGDPPTRVYLLPTQSP